MTPRFDHEDRLIIGGDRSEALQLLQAAFRQHGAGDAGRADVHDPEVEVATLGVLLRFRVVVLPQGTREFRVDLGVADLNPPGDALGHKVIPCQILCIFRVGIGGRPGGNPAHLFPGDLECCGKHAFMRDAHGCRRLGHPVEIDQRAAVRAFAVGRPHHEAVGDGMPAILLEELVERRLAQTRHKDRFIVRYELDVEKTTVEIQHHQHVDRCAGKAGQRGHRFGLEDIAGLRPAGVQQLPDALIVHRFAQRHGRCDIAFQHLARQRFRSGDVPHGGRKHGSPDPCETERWRFHAASLDTPTHALHATFVPAAPRRAASPLVVSTIVLLGPVAAPG